ncbi:MAG: serine acetyltransferase [Phycisphaerae bacterium]|nr:serine acetyltransferase [Phycisphaerae bacterium]
MDAHGRSFPERLAIEEVLRWMRGAFLNDHHGFGHSAEDCFQRACDILRTQAESALTHCALRGGGTLDRSAALLRTKELLAELRRARPAIAALIESDVQAAFDRDPAAHCPDEVPICYPGVRALVVHRIAHVLWQLGLPVIPRLMGEIAHTETGIDVHPGATIGEGFFIDHGTGVVIGETTVIGKQCTIYQGVTLGAVRFPTDDAGRVVKGQRRHPTLEDGVTVYANTTILGGATVIGAGSTVAGGVFVTESVPAGSVVHAAKLDVQVKQRRSAP